MIPGLDRRWRAGDRVRWGHGERVYDAPVAAVDFESNIVWVAVAGREYPLEFRDVLAVLPAPLLSAPAEPAQEVNE